MFAILTAPKATINALHDRLLDKTDTHIDATMHSIQMFRQQQLFLSNPEVSVDVLHRIEDDFLALSNANRHKLSNKDVRSFYMGVIKTKLKYHQELDVIERALSLIGVLKAVFFIG